MRLRAAPFTVRAIALLLVTLWASACASESPAPATDGSLQVERTTEGSVTTVRNLSGSTWGGDATLAVELEIGVDEGDERYMLVNPYPYFATEDEIFVAEGRDGRIRVYGFDGIHRRDFGKPGPGPGELGHIVGLLVTGDGRVVVSHFSRAAGAFKVSLFSLEGAHLEDWSVGSMMSGELMPLPRPDSLADTPDGLLGMVRERPEKPGDDLQIGYQRIGKDGFLGEPWMIPKSDREPPTLTVEMPSFNYEQPVPYAVSGPVAAVTPAGDRVWGYPHEYRFQIEHRDGRVTVVERVTEAVPIHPDEADHARRRVIASISQRNSDFTWDGSGIPETKPWYRSFIPDHDGRIWVSREGPAEPVPDCTEPEEIGGDGPYVPCWEARPLMDVFDLDGEFLGSLQRPQGTPLFGPVIRGDSVVAGHQDELGVWKIRVYRIVIPGTEEEPT